MKVMGNNTTPTLSFTNTCTYIKDYLLT